LNLKCRGLIGIKRGYIEGLIRATEEKNALKNLMLKNNRLPAYAKSIIRE
jgi:hypothetical protein